MIYPLQIVIFHSYVSLPEGKNMFHQPLDDHSEERLRRSQSPTQLAVTTVWTDAVAVSNVTLQ